MNCRCSVLETRNRRCCTTNIVFTLPRLLTTLLADLQYQLKHQMMLDSGTYTAVRTAKVETSTLVVAFAANSDSMIAPPPTSAVLLWNRQEDRLKTSVACSTNRAPPMPESDRPSTSTGEFAALPVKVTCTCGPSVGDPGQTEGKMWYG